MPSRSAEQARVIKTVSKARSPAASGTSGTNDLVDQYRRLADEETPGGLLSAGGAFVDFPGAVLLAGHNGIVLNANDLAEPIGQVMQSGQHRLDEHTYELQSLMRISNAVYCSTNKKHHTNSRCL